MKQNLIVARIGGGVEPDLIMQCDLRLSKQGGKTVLDKFYIIKIIEFECRGNNRLFNEKIIDLHSKLVLSAENQPHVWPVKTIIDCSENVTYESPDFNWEYSISLINIVQGGEWNSQMGDTAIMKTSRPILMNKVKPHMDLSLEDGQKARVVFIDNTILAKEMKASLKSIMIKSINRSNDMLVVQAQSRKEALSLLACVGIFEATRNLDFSADFEQPNIPVI